MTKGVLLAALAAVLLVMHLDFWFWDTPDPLLFGIVPVGLWWQAAFALGCAVMMFLYDRYLWPKHLEALENLPPRGGDDAGAH